MDIARFIRELFGLQQVSEQQEQTEQEEINEEVQQSIENTEGNGGWNDGQY